MDNQVIIVPVDGATNIKLEVLDFDSLATLKSFTTGTPVAEEGGLQYNRTGDECRWFDECVKKLPEELKGVAVIAPVSRGASGGLVGRDNTLCEVPGKDLTLAYIQTYPDEVEERFAAIAGSESEYFLETGSVRGFPGSIALIKRILFEEMKRPELLKASAAFAYYGALLSGHFLGDDYLAAWEKCGNEHSYWMCHTGARNINKKAGTPSSLVAKLPSFWKLVPRQTAVTYQAIGRVPEKQARDLGLKGASRVVPGGHDTCLSHIPVMSTFYQAFGDRAGKPVVHVDAGTWTMVAQIGGKTQLKGDGYLKGIVVQGTVDGEPVVTAMYAGGNDFKHVKGLVEVKGLSFKAELDEDLLKAVLTDTSCMVLPNIHPDNKGTGPFPNREGSILNEATFFEDGARAYIRANLPTVITTDVNIGNIEAAASAPIVLTAGGSKDPYFGKLLATLTGRAVYAMQDKHGKAVTETTTLGAAIVGKAACQGIHPYEVDMSDLGVTYKELAPFGEDIRKLLVAYKKELLRKVAGWD